MNDKDNKIEILIIEGNELQGGFLESIFNKQIYQTTRITDGKEGYNFLLSSTNQSLVILISYHLPSLDGLSIMRRLKDAGKHFAFIFLTANKTVEAAIEAMKSGAMDFIPKTINLQERLPQMVDKVYQLQQERIERDRMKHELHENREKLRSTIASMDDYLLILDENGLIVDFHHPESPENKYILPHIAFGDSYKNISLTGNFAQILDNAISKLLATSTVQKFDYSLTQKSNTFWFSVKVSIRKNPKGEFSGSTIVLRNITKQKQAQITLRESEERLQTIMHSLQIGVMVVELENKHIVDINPYGCQIINKRKEQITGNEASQYLQSFVEKSQSWYKNSKKNGSYESYLFTNDNRQIPVLETIAIIKLNGKKHFLINFVDISVQREITIKLQQQNIEIQQQKEEILAQRDQLQAQRDYVTRQRDQIIQQNQEITDSIHYARRIQSALLPPDEFIRYLFSDYFIFYEPRNIVSGDFYWMTQKGAKILIASADCTGHGVPGAFMSMLGMSILNETVNTLELTQVDEILNELRTSIIKSLRQTGQKGEAKDGMDIALCTIDFEKQILYFAGANSPVYLIRDETEGGISELPDNKMIISKLYRSKKTGENYQLIHIKGDKMPISIHKKASVPFKQQKIHLHNGDKMYLFSDGYVDQFGGRKNRKFLTKNFKQLLIDIQHLSMKEQNEIITKKHEEWRGEQKQVDDILVIGLNMLFDEIEVKSTTRHNWRNKTILIAEDLEDNFIYLEELLSTTNANILWAKNGKEAIDLCKENRDIDLVLMDIQMPYINGYEATQQIKQFRNSLPVIVQTAFSMSGEKEKSFKSGCDDYISKPINHKELIATVSKYIV